jgi:hypothetical protein
MFDAREFLARQLGCTAPELVRRNGRIWLGEGSQAQAYDRAGTLAGRIVVTRPRRNLAGQNGRLVAAAVAGRPTGYHEIGPDEEFSW